MKVIHENKRYCTSKSKSILRTETSEEGSEHLWLTKKGTWLMEVKYGRKAVLLVINEEQAFEFLQDAQFLNPSALPANMDSQGVANLIEQYFPNLISDE